MSAYHVPTQARYTRDQGHLGRRGPAEYDRLPGQFGRRRRKPFGFEAIRAFACPFL